MKTTLLLLLLAVACTPKKAKDPEPAPTEIGDTVIGDAHATSRNSLDYLGVYKGSLPAHNYRDTPVTLELSEEFNYTLTFADTVAKGQKSETKGTFKWNKGGNGILLSHPGIFPSEFAVAEGKLIPKTGAGGDPLDEKRSAKYTLVKLSEGEAAKTDQAPRDQLPPKLTGIRWKLSEINGKPVTPAGGRDYFLQLNKDGSFGAFAGCNNMGGKYELKGSKVRMFNIISTMMACAEMKTEDDFKIALETSDNFVTNKKVLQFRKGGRNLLKFEADLLPKP